MGSLYHVQIHWKVINIFLTIYKYYLDLTWKDIPLIPAWVWIFGWARPWQWPRSPSYNGLIYWRVLHQRHLSAVLFITSHRYRRHQYATQQQTRASCIQKYHSDFRQLNYDGTSIVILPQLFLQDDTKKTRFYAGNPMSNEGGSYVWHLYCLIPILCAIALMKERI